MQAMFNEVMDMVAEESRNDKKGGQGQ